MGNALRKVPEDILAGIFPSRNRRGRYHLALIAPIPFHILP
ncbi:hypothetical protein CES86_5582 [Brucella lupini]|uniref:Uncharacterized protein n=1 Tax=Brucella lupini TaxID=255457 RepID=A0A256GZY9_9HYPH|nr:hypothetical protein CES86_5582 [Brucella lupini]